MKRQHHHTPHVGADQGRGREAIVLEMRPIIDKLCARDEERRRRI